MEVRLYRSCRDNVTGSYIYFHVVPVLFCCVYGILVLAIDVSLFFGYIVYAKGRVKNKTSHDVYVCGLACVKFNCVQFRF